MVWIILAGYIFSGWMTLLIMSRERHRRIEEFQREARLAAEHARQLAEAMTKAAQGR